MNGRTIGYWITTALLALPMVGSGIGDLLLAEPIREGLVDHLHYPLYFPRLLGIWKLLGVVAILAPGFPRLKEWAYAGFFFAMTGATYSHVAAGDPGGAPVTGILSLFVLASWALRPEGRRLGTVLPG